MSEREKIAARIRALLAKTVENGCTEDEAVAAAALAAKLLEKYNLTLDEVEIRKSDFEWHREQFADEVGARLWKVASAVAHLTDTQTWVSPKGVFPYEISFFGLDHEVEIAKYLLAICAYAMRSEQEQLQTRFALLRREKRRQKIIPFLDGMADSLHRRIRALKPPAPTGTGLVVLKNQLITEEMAKAGIKLDPIQMRRSRDFDEEYRWGVEAGDRVSLNPGLTGESRNLKRLSA
jgi:hypothetical protein